MIKGLYLLLAILMSVGALVISVAQPNQQTAYGAPPQQATATPEVGGDVPTLVEGEGQDITQAGDYAATILSGGLVRRYLYHVPTGYDGQTAMPLVISFHGFTSTPLENEGRTQFSDKADEEGFIVVYPEGFGAAEDPKGWFSQDDPTGEFPDDVQFTRDIIAKMVDTYTIDISRIYVTGVSNGGGMAHRVGCNMSDIVAAIVPVIGAYLEEDPCDATRAVPVLAMHGRLDAVQKYDGILLTFDPVPEVFTEWAQRDGCDLNSEITQISDDITEQRWSDCTNGVEVVLRTYETLGHSYPPDGTEVAWDFLSQYQLSEEETANARQQIVVETTHAGDFRVTIVSGGEVRAYLLHVPLSYSPDVPMPVVMSFHDYGSNPVGNLQLTRLNSLAETQDFILVIPQGRGEPLAWFTQSDAPENFPTDTQFFLDILENLKKDLMIDENRVYATGFSLGGGMANRIACDLADHVTAIAIVNGAHWLGQSCSPSRPVPVIAFHMRDNEVAAYDGYKDVLESIAQWTEEWVGANGCDLTSESTSIAGGVSRDSWKNCEAPLILYTYETGGHTWPNEVNALIWDFFSQYSLDEE